MAVHPDLIHESTSNIINASELMTDWSLSKKQHIGYNPTPGYWMIGSSSRLIQNSPKGSLALDLDACNNYKGASIVANNITQRVQIISGKEDKMTSTKNAMILSENFENVTLKILDNTGHMIMVEQPFIIAKELYQFSKNFL